MNIEEQIAEWIESLPPDEKAKVYKIQIATVKQIFIAGQKHPLECLSMAMDWIDTVPSEVELPAMPGFDRDYVNGILENRRNN